ncbi:hypothetical protein HJ588_04335 [Flexivirga sp. ID2601S]|uniref:YcaO domain-containing protein n=1 Tax=Flexivirga aerilata TaxID=1656889 RepID=A0A849AF94_9MICO|nr:hypothetical protein [Flexivirga aerilata]
MATVPGDHLVVTGAFDRSSAQRQASTRAAVAARALAQAAWCEDTTGNTTIAPEDLGLPPALPRQPELWASCIGLVTGDPYTVPVRGLMPSSDGDRVLNLIAGGASMAATVAVATQHAVQETVARDLVARWWRRAADQRRPLLPAHDLLLEAISPARADELDHENLSVSGYLLRVGAGSTLAVVTLRCVTTGALSIGDHLVGPWTPHEALREAFVEASVRRAVAVEAIGEGPGAHPDTQCLVRRWLMGPRIHERLSASCAPVRPNNLPDSADYTDVITHAMARYDHEPVAMIVAEEAGCLAAACCPGTVEPLRW